MSYTKILVAVGPGDDADPLLARAIALSEKLGAGLTAVSVVDVVVPTAGLMSGAGMETGTLDVSNQVVLTESLLENQRSRMAALCTRHGLAPEQMQVRVGAQAIGILEAARELGADLIVVGHHRHKGLGSFFSHTDEAVVHRSNCDVLAISLDAG